MADFNALLLRLNNWLSESENSLCFNGCTADQWIFIFKNFLVKQEPELNKRSKLFVFDNESDAENFYELVKSELEARYYPGLGHSPYSSIVSSEAALFQRFNILNDLSQSNKTINIITTLEALNLKGPSADFFNSNLEVAVDQIISPEDLAKSLIERGYINAPSVEEAGTFSRKGEIFDIYPSNANPIRIHYFDDLIENIFEIDHETLKTNRNRPIKNILLGVSSHFLIQSKYINNLRENIVMPQPTFKNKYENRKDIFSKLKNKRLFDNYPIFTPLFFKDSATLLDFLSDDSLVFLFDYNDSEKSFELFQEQIIDEYNNDISDKESENLIPEPQKVYNFDYNFNKFKQLYINSIKINLSLDEDIKNEISLKLEPTKSFLHNKTKTSESADRFNFIKSSFNTLKNEMINTECLYFVYKNDSSLEEFKFLINENLKMDRHGHKIKFINFPLEQGFVYSNEKLIFLTESDIFSRKKSKTKSNYKKDIDLFAEQFATLKVNDFVIHRDHGIGVYKGLESINLGGQETDFLVIIYEGNDKVYVPVYKLNLIQKHADGNSSVRIASLKSKKFDKEKHKARQAVAKLAFDLLELQAKRKLSKGFQFSPPDHDFKDFELSFPYKETPDQMNAIHDVLEDMQDTSPMDRLICGDVGFGKTEVAMRATFKAVQDSKQVAILVPTTILAFQHFNSFKERFKSLPVNIELLSRFRSAKESKDIIEKLDNGQVDIIIGTHKLLSGSIKYHDLGLVIVDEEHRFGVGHKEKLKLLKSNLDFLTMTATPIPRTLQLSFLGIKDLSLIQTAPPKRQSIKSYLIKEDQQTIRSAIEKELSRGGQVFIVHNRVRDIEEFSANILKLVPKASIVVAHGQLPEKELEKKIQQFYSGKFDILVATTIIESGIDIPRANTMIIDRADTYGLSQLHQLRGRIGRSDKKAYAYFVIPKHRNLTPIAARRLKALQTYAEIGSGFALASSDLEIRGAGDILGADQSGHIGNIGLELYMDLLSEAVQELQGSTLHENKDIEVQTPFEAYIPNNYIKDSSLRLKYYKKLSNSSSFERFISIKDELEDIYGHAPSQLQNLFCILETRITLKAHGVKSIKLANKIIHLWFDTKVLEQNNNLNDQVIQHFLSRPEVYKLNPDFSVRCTFADKVSAETLLEFAKYIAEQIHLC